MRKSHSVYALLSLLLAACLCSGCGIVFPNDPTGIEEPLESDSDSTSVYDTDPGTGDAVPPQKIENDFSETAQAYLRQITDIGFQYDGTTFLIASPRTDVISPETADTIYSSARLERTQQVESALNVRIITSYMEEVSCFDVVHASVLADEYYSDLLMIPQNQIGLFVANDILINLRSMPFLNLDKPYFFSDSITAASVSGGTYAVAGSASLEETSVNAVYFNRDLFETNGLSLPYQAVYDGTWTWDTFFTYAAAADDSNGVSSFTYQYSADMLAGAVFFSAGGRFVRASAENVPVIAFSESQDGMRASILTKLFSDPNRYADTDSGVSHFHNGNSLFLLDRLYLMSWMPDSQQNWGILPFPKLDERQAEYISLCSDSSLFFAVQKNSVSTERISMVLSALNAASYGVLSEAYVDYAMNHLLRDNDSTNMLEILAFSSTYDFSYSFASTNAALYSATVGGFREIADGISFQALCDRIGQANTQLQSRYS